jgi:TonB family protein
MTLNRDKITAFTGTVLVFLLLAFFLLYFGLERTIPVEKEEGLYVNFGTVEASSGLFEPETADRPQPTETNEAPPEVSTEELIVQDMESSLALAEKKKESTKKKIEAEQQLKASEIKMRTASVFAKSFNQAKNQGTAEIEAGNQGVETGSPSVDNTVGGGQGYGDFSLDGRSAVGALPRPSYTIQEEGNVVVKIIVSPKGNVISSSISLQGTTTDNQILRTAALSAAKQARFNEMTTTQNQTGTITYHFRLK